MRSTAYMDGLARPGASPFERLVNNLGMGDLSKSSLKPRRLLVWVALALGALVWLNHSRNGQPLSVSSGQSLRIGHAVSTRQLKAKPLRSTAPTAKFRDNLLPDHRYIHAGHMFGHNNQFIEICKLFVLGHRTGRTPILDDMHAEHGEGSSPPLSDFYNLNPVANRLDMAFVTWDEVKTKDQTLSQEETLSCWTTFMPWFSEEGGLWPYKVKLRYWEMPLLLDEYPLMSTLEMLSEKTPKRYLRKYKEQIWEKRWGREKHWREWRAKQDDYDGRYERTEIDREIPDLPDEQLFCIDQAFYVREGRRKEDGRWNFKESYEVIDPASALWDQVGKHISFQPQVDKLADAFLQFIFGRTPRARVPQYFIGVHLRQGDFVKNHRHVADPHQLPAVYYTAVAEVQAELIRTRGGKLAGLPVVFATDSDLPEFVARITKEYGWIYLDHAAWKEEQKHEHKGWLPGLLDSVVLSRAIGLVGTKQSTFSGVAARRVEDWNAGVTRIVDPAS